jgi:hypothetical protein
LSHTPSALCRTGAALCVCVILGGVLAGCAPRNVTKATPSPSASLNPHYAKAAELAANLRTLGAVIGDITGTMTVGGEDRTLTGQVALNSTGSQIKIVENGTASTTLSETIVGGNRYTSHDDTTWVFRGPKAKGEDLATLLANADTSVDAGVATANGVTGHRIMTAPDKMDVAPALGLDTYTFDQETTTLRIWADDAGKVLGFGASMSWKIMVGGALQDVTADLDVIFAAKATPVDIVAPKDAWQWKQDLDSGIGLGYQGSNGGVKADTSWTSNPAGKATVSDAVKSFVDAWTSHAGAQPPSGTSSVVVDSEDSFWLTVDAKETSEHTVVLFVEHEKQMIQFKIVGAASDKTKLDAFALKLFSTIEWTR